MNKDNGDSNIFSNEDFTVRYYKKYISQNNYKSEMLSKVEPYLKEKSKNGYILGIDNVKLYYEKYINENPKANIVICHGFGEFTEKYNELIYYFVKDGYSAFVIEHRGNGRSQRLGIDNYQINVEKFDYYVSDFKKFIDEVVIPSSKNKELFLFAHSMGGAIGTIFLEEYTDYFTAAVLSAPMHEINTGKIPKILAVILSNTMKFFGKGGDYLPGQSPYKERKSFYSRSTSCKERYYYLNEKIINNNDYKSGGPSACWYIESVKADKKLIKKENASRVKIPVLLFQAEYDTHVIPKAQNKFASHASNCKIIHIKSAKHEAYSEIDDISFTFFDKTLSFFEENIK